MTTTELKPGDTVSIKGVRSRTNGRYREAGTIQSIDAYQQARVDCGAVIYEVRVSRLILLKRAEDIR